MLNKYIYIILIFCCCTYPKSKSEKKEPKSINEGFWFDNTYYGNNQLHTSTLLDKDTIPIKIISYRKNGSIEGEFLFSSHRDSLGYGLAIYYDSSNRIGNVEIVGISRSDTWKGYTIFYREKELMKMNMEDYKKWKEKIEVKGKEYYFNW